MSAGVTFERVYHALKEELGSGRYAAGQHLEPAALSRDLNASITPVRDALHRLAGEGLVETPRGEGFRMPLMTEVGLRHLYRWNAGLLDLAARGRSGPEPTGRGEDSEPAGAAGAIETTEHLFLKVAARSGNPEHGATIATLNDRLRAVRQVELALMADPLAELEPIAALLASDTLPGLRRTLAAYHRRRERLVGELVAALVAPR
ncbi:GntR family transcriptional regulator [Altererythrobacter sp. Root672]|uniref:GntR family transcriptional regulator n=1 Tax=Altererythrobacter sp. Root672 TaxID=1736584 RepID=UPI0006F3D5D3|nr:GntR family transcriptional regulator [Altererythrobacter sp. Root672]KRA84103.1 hypothetical protein ASD76_08930 [Altererythrobacter sp. Root672]